MILSTGYKSSTYYSRAALKELRVKLWKSRHAQMPSMKQIQKNSYASVYAFFFQCSQTQLINFLICSTINFFPPKKSE